MEHDSLDDCQGWRSPSIGTSIPEGEKKAQGWYGRSFTYDSGSYRMRCEGNQRVDPTLWFDTIPLPIDGQCIHSFVDATCVYTPNDDDCSAFCSRQQGGNML